LHPCPPTEFALAQKPDSETVYLSDTTARQRAVHFAEEVPLCGEILSFARTYFEKNER
jgi:hypothetical protein